MDPLAHLNAALTHRYEVERELGSGGMATVYLARDLKHNRSVALKVLRPDLGVVLGAERFFAEIEVTANLQHPNLLPLFDSGDADGQLFYVMPYVEGESLRARLDRERQLPVEEAVHIATSVASALDYAHRHGVVHRDLKPENILLHEGQPMVSDFGIALAVSNAGGGRITQTGVSLGTPQYMSPEQATGDRVIDARTDVYSLGAVTYEMLTGEPPHAGTTAQAVIARVLTETPRSIRAFRPNVPEHVERAVARALEKLPADRLASAQEFADALSGRLVVPASAAAGERTGTKDAATPARDVTWRETLRHPLTRTLAWALALTLIGGAVWAFRSAGRGADAHRPVRFVLALEDSLTWQDGTGSPFALSPDGGLLAFVGRRGGATRRLFVRPLDELRARELPGTEGAQMPFFSPDGKWIGYGSGGRLMKVLAEGGAPLYLADVPGMTGGSWSVRDEIVLGGRRGLVAVPAAGGAARTVLDGGLGAGGVGALLWPLTLPDGKTALYAVASGGAARIGVVSLESGESRLLDLPGGEPLAFLDGTLVYAGVAGAIMAVPFDLASLRPTGTPTPVVDGVAVGSRTEAKASVSAVGSLVYVTGDPGAGLQLMVASAGSVARPVLPDAGNYAYPRYSPDGRHLAFTAAERGRTDVWILDLPSGPLRRLTTDGTVNDRPEWTPDSRRVLFRSNRGGRNAYWIQPADGSRLAEPYFGVAQGAADEAMLSSDGAWLLVQVDTTTCNCVGTSYYRSTTGDTTLVSIAGSIPGQQTTARISPDRRWIAYRSNETGTLEVYVKPFPALDVRYQVSLAGGEQPVWSPDGRRLYYLSGMGDLLSATLSYTPTFSVVARDTVLTGVAVNPLPPTSANHANFDVSPDGRSFVFVHADDAQGRVIVVHDWKVELRARLEAGRR